MMTSKASRAFALSTSTMPSCSLAPFLYQTRTLADITWSKTSRPRHHAASTRAFSSTHRQRYAINHNNIPRLSSTSAANTTKWSPLPAQVSDCKDVREVESDTISQEYQERRKDHQDTRSLDRNRWNSSSSRRDEAATYQGYNGTYLEEYPDVMETKSIDFDEEVGEDYLVNRDEIADLTRSHPLGESTITDTERYAFQKIFRDIFGRNQGAGTGIDDGFGNIMPSKDADNAKTRGKALPTAASRNNNMSKYEMEDMVNRYPAPLRAAAARAIGLTEAEAEGESDVPDEEPEIDMEKVEMLRQPERDRVETLMKNAESDFELWKVMEKEVFSLISSLGLQDIEKPLARGSKKVNSRSKNSKEVQTSNQQESIPEDSAQLQKFSTNQDGISPLALYGPLYPSYLLLGLRLLDRSFAKSSPLTLTLLPKIKSLGLISHVLGASSQLYNELLQIHRYRYDDYRGILQLLSEMEHSGIEFDHETLDIVQDIQRTQISVRKGEKGSAIQALWSLPEFAPNKFKIWQDKIGGDIKSRTIAQQATMRY